MLRTFLAMLFLVVLGAGGLWYVLNAPMAPGQPPPRPAATAGSEPRSASSPAERRPASSSAEPRPSLSSAEPRPSLSSAEPRPVGSLPASAAAAIATPFGDAMFRWRCTSGLLDRLGAAPDWPLRRVAGLCLCLADRLREEGPRELPLPGADLPRALAEAEARLCRRG